MSPGWRFPDFPLQNIPPPALSNGPADRPNRTAGSTTKASFPATHSKFSRSQGSSSHEEGYQGDDDDDDDDDQGHKAGDPRNIHRQVPARKEKSAAENLLHAMIREFLAESGHYFSNQKVQTIAQLPDGPNPLSVESYANRVGKGPSNDQPLFSWNHPISHPWNVAVIRILASRFQGFAGQTGLTRLLLLLNPSRRANTSTIDFEKVLAEIGDVEKLIAEKIGYQQNKLRNAMRNVHSMHGKTDAEIGSALCNKASAERTRARRNERRRNLFLRRATIIEDQLRLSDSELWRQIDLLFSHFGDEDISSDETDIEKGFGAPKVIRRVCKVWVCADISKVFHFIDGHYNSRTVTGTLKKGSAPLKRERGSYKCNSLAPPRPMLPINFYNKEIGDERIQTLEPKPPIQIPQISMPGAEMEVD